MPSARQVYINTSDAVQEQRDRLGLGSVGGSARWDRATDRFVADPRREPEPNLIAILEYIRPEQLVLDVGGGAGRLGLPIALRAKEVINVEPSQGMCDAFAASARDAGITNAKCIAKEWTEAEDVVGDVSLVVNVTYFVRDPVPFLEKLNSASRERVIIGIGVTPPPNQSARVFELTHDEPQAHVPGYRELLPVLWELGIVPDVRVLNEARASNLRQTYADRDSALESLRDASRAASPIGPDTGDDSEAARLRDVFEAHFDELFEPVPNGFRRRVTGDPRMMLITWRTNA